MDKNTYSKLKDIYSDSRFDVMAMVLTYILDKGWSNIKELTDEEIESFEGNGIMTKGFVQHLAKTAREVCNAVENPTELYQFCDAYGIYETTYFSDGEHLSRSTLEDGLRKLVEYVLYDEEIIMPTSSEEETKEQLADLLDIEVEELEKLIN